MLRLSNLLFACIPLIALALVAQEPEQSREYSPPAAIEGGKLRQELIGFAEPMPADQSESETLQLRHGMREGYAVATATGHGVKTPQHSIGLFRGNFTPDPGVDSRVINIAMKNGRAFAFVLFEDEEHIMVSAIESLQSAGVVFRGVLPGDAWQIEIPVGALESLQTTPGVRWVGELPLEHKHHPQLEVQRQNLAPGQPLRAFVGLMGDDWIEGQQIALPGIQAFTEEGLDQRQAKPTFLPNGPFQRTLEGLGLKITRYARNTRAFAVEGPPQVIFDLAKRNDVHFLDDNSPHKLSHDESIPMMGQDYIRSSFGGATTEIGIIDTEIMMYPNNPNEHVDLSVWAVGWDLTGQGVGQNAHGHGTHVAGTVFGRGVADARMKGMAPEIGGTATQRVFHGRYFDSTNHSHGNVSDLYDNFSSNYTDSSGRTTTKPKIVNNSWGADGSFNGTEQHCIDVDDAVWDHKQTYVFAAGNDGLSGPRRVGVPAAAKNVIAVANATTYPSDTATADSGELHPTSSRGPTGDNRLKPEITAPGHLILSADAFNPTGYVEKGGTSMAAPHITGALASLFENYPGVLDANPKLARAWTASSALKKSGNLAPNNDYGFGYFNSYKANFDGANWESLYIPAAIVNENTQWIYAMVDVPANCSRLGLYLNWDEPGCSIFAGSSPILGHVEMYLDFNNDQAAGNAGDESSTGQANYQFLVIDNPPAGNHKVKLWPVDTAVSGWFAEDLEVSLVIQKEFDDVRPSHTASVAFIDDTVQPGETATLKVDVSSPTYIATNTHVFVNDNPDTLPLTGRRVHLADGQVLSYDTTDLGQWQGGPGAGANAWILESVSLGAIKANSTRTVEFDFTAPNQDDFHPLGIRVNNDNGPTGIGSTSFGGVWLIVDGTPPSIPGSLSAPNNPIGSWSQNPTITYTWNDTDPFGSGTDGYAYNVNFSALPPGTNKMIEEVTSLDQVVPEGEWYFTIRTVDNSGNWSNDFADYGPVGVDYSQPEAVTHLVGKTHDAGVLSFDPNITFAWDAATDAVSGIDGYGIWIHYEPAIPAAIKDIEEVESYSTVLPNGVWYINVRSVDNAGNWDDDYESWGPVFILDDPTPTLEIRNLVAGQTAEIEFSECTPGGKVHFVWSGTGAGPVGTPFGNALVTPPYTTFKMTVNDLGYANRLKDIPPGTSGMPIWCHGADLEQGVMTNPLALTIG